MIAMTVAALLLASGAQERDPVFAGYAGSTSLVEEHVLVCNRERYVVTLSRGRLVQLRTPWGMVADADLATVAGESEALTYIRDVGLICSPTEFQVTFSGRLREEPEDQDPQEVDLPFWFRGGRLLAPEEGGRGRRGPSAVEF